MLSVQPGILEDVPSHASYLFFSLKHEANPASSLKQLAAFSDGDKCIAGLSQSLVQNLSKTVPGLKAFPALSANGVNIPSTNASLWIWLRGDDRGELLLESLKLEQLLSESFQLDQKIDAFRYREGRDLSGYVDGTENPQGNDAVKTAFVQNETPGLEGSSFVAVQQWLHDLAHFQEMPQHEQDETIGRQISDNEEIDDAPPSAHVKRTAQESFDPEAFVLRRSMPWNDSKASGLVFVAFGHSFAAYETLLNNMTGLNDGIVDALFHFTRPVTGHYFWCPPLKDGSLDLSLLEL